MAKKPSKADTGDGKSANREASAKGAAPYVVLARKYRPTTFDDLIGQDAMVTTLKNAFATDRIAQGYMLTGVRGVGKTTTARILSRALNYEREGVDKPTFDMPEFGRHCVEIMEGRHPDVLEMDAASNTGVDNIREIIESARYRPLVARYKVYLIDEVHMLSKGAFNALLKTLEEPPGHVKFIFATTEVRKVPVTVLSRCQRFDLRRVDVPVLMAALQEDRCQGRRRGRGRRPGADRACGRGLGARWAVAARPGAGHEFRQRRAPRKSAPCWGWPIAGASSICWRSCLAARPAKPCSSSRRLYGDGAEPQQVLADLAEAVHVTTRAKTLGVEAAGDGLSRRGKAPRRRARRAAVDGDPVARLADAAQGPGRGRQRAQSGGGRRDGADPPRLHGRPAAARRDHQGAGRRRRRCADRQAGCAGGEAARRRPRRPSTFSDAEAATRAISAMRTMARQDYAPAALPVVRSFAEVVELAGARREAKLKVHLEEHVSLVKFDPAGSIELHLLAGAPKELANELREKLNAWTGKRWMVALSKSARRAHHRRGAARARRRRDRATCRRHPAVAAVLQQFPDAEITSVRPLPKHRQGRHRNRLRASSGAAMKDLMKLMKQAGEIQGRMQKMQEELAALEVEGQSGAGLVKVRLNGKMEARGHQDRPEPDQAGRGGDAGGPDRCRVPGRQGQGRDGRAGQDAGGRPAACSCRLG